MNAFERIIEDLNSADLDYIEQKLKPLDDFKELTRKYFESIHAAIKIYQETGIEQSIEHLDNWEEVASVEANSVEINSIKENIEPQKTDEKNDSLPRTRSRRNAFKEASQNINTQNIVSSNRKSKKPSKLQDVYVKIEKLSISNTDRSADIIDKKIKTEVEEMPAPTLPVLKRKKRKGESKIQVKQETEESPGKFNRESDVIIHDVTLTTVTLLDSSSEGEQTLKNDEKTNKDRIKEMKAKRSRTYSSDEENKSSALKRSKSNEDTNCENAASTIHDGKDLGNVTYDIGLSTDRVEPTNMNTTVVVDKPKYVSNIIPQSVDDMMTDDESEEEVQKIKTPPKPFRTIPKPIKQVFSPFEQSPVKKKVQAFEKLKAEANAIPTRVTRTKTRAQAKEQEAEGEDNCDTEPKSNVKEKAKLFTPVTSKFIPKAASTMLKSRTAASSSNESLLSAKSASALKASQAEYREREKKRREKEQEALKKRDALIQAQIEEKKRKREEKQFKAQQQREALEKEKLKTLEAQKLKDERHKQLMAEQEEKKQKQKEELEKKRLMAKLRAIEEKKREEEKRIEEQKKAEEIAAKLKKQDKEMARMLQKQKQKSVPMYMKTRTPLLPTEDCYDSDDDSYRNEAYSPPEWSKSSNLNLMQKCAFAAGEAIKNTFFSIQAQTPDLQDIFEVIEPQKLKRSSSAVWHKPPRFTMVPGLEHYDEIEEFDDE